MTLERPCVKKNVPFKVLSQRQETEIRYYLTRTFTITQTIE